MDLSISKDFTFEASHVLPRHPGKCSRLHGHSWRLRVTVRGPIDPTTGFVCDYATLKHLVEHHVISRLDHQHLGQGDAGVGVGTPSYSIHYAALGPDFYPSSERLVEAIANILQPLMRELGGEVELESIVLNETCTCAAELRPGGPGAASDPTTGAERGPGGHTL